MHSTTLISLAGCELGASDLLLFALPLEPLALPLADGSAADDGG